MRDQGAMWCASISHFIHSSIAYNVPNVFETTLHRIALHRIVYVDSLMRSFLRLQTSDRGVSLKSWVQLEMMSAVPQTWRRRTDDRYTSWVNSFRSRAVLFPFPARVDT
jgi:hypothetical protein